MWQVWLLRANGGTTIVSSHKYPILFEHLQDLTSYIFQFQDTIWIIEYIKIYTKPERAEGKERTAPLVPLSRAKQD